MSARAHAALLLLAFALTARTTQAQSRPAPTAQAARLSGPVHIDGRLDEAAWKAASPVTAFTQLDPDEGQPASERSEVYFLIGDDALYVGARLFDSEPGKIHARLARRDDGTDSDLFEVFLDSHHDHLTASRFRVNPAGAIRDAAIGADGSEDDSWDPVWSAAAHVDSLGWTAEMRIPLSQLRYDPRNPDWGLQIARGIHRKSEGAYFAFTPKNEQGGVSRYGTLTGLGHLPAPRHLELVPYATARNERLHFEPGNPFRSSDDWFASTGLDVKYGINSHLTLDATVNPDFGQVEVDPAEVNLTAFETFFAEKRPFFVENADVFAFGQSRAMNNYGFRRVLNSRRIGRAPHLTLGGPAYDHVDAPDQTTIDVAAKLTGKTPSGWSIGVLDALTGREHAHFIPAGGGPEGEAVVEPRTHFFTGRLKRDLNGGNTVIGGMLTAVHRRDESAAIRDQAADDAYVAGLDFNHAWAQRRYAFDASVAHSIVRGSTGAIGALQRSSARYYQRPDHEDYATYDPTRTRLTGWTTDLSLAKTSGEHWLGSLAWTATTPGYEANDLGFMTRSDYQGVSELVLFMQNKPGKFLRSYTIMPYANQIFDYGGDIIYNGYALSTNGTFLNYWDFNLQATGNQRTYEDRLTRGGPQAKLPVQGSIGGGFGTDSRRPWTVNPSYSYSWNAQGGWGASPALSIAVRPSPTLRVAFEPSYSNTHALAQFVTSQADPAATTTYGQRYVFSTLDQRVASLTTRVDWTFTPRMSLQVYLQPLVVTGHYSDFKEFKTPREFEFAVYGRDQGSITRDANGVSIDPGNGSRIEFGDPDFNFRSLLGNAVLRWEYRPGSTLFFVWQQQRTDFQPFGDFEFRRDYPAMLDRSPENVFAVKATWWLPV
ncbi:MAG: DUF5916 domain-containing protein [Candidatus Eisenbacteria bacterium]